MKRNNQLAKGERMDENTERGWLDKRAIISGFYFDKIELLLFSC